MATQTVIVTGAESGIGAACAEAFGATGARVAILFHSAQGNADATAEAVRKAGGEAMTVQVGVDDEASVDRAFATVEKNWGAADAPVSTWRASPCAT